MHIRGHEDWLESSSVSHLDSCCRIWPKMSEVSHISWFGPLRSQPALQRCVSDARVCLTLLESVVALGAFGATFALSLLDLQKRSAVPGGHTLYTSGDMKAGLNIYIYIYV